MENSFKNNLYKLFKKDARLWNEETKELNETLLKNLIDKLDEKIIEILLSEKETKEKFFIKVKDIFVLRQNELKFFIDENKLDNSYTQYQNKIGLRVGDKLLSERNEVALDWPFKDCVLEGGMTKEDQKRNEIFFNEILAKDEIDRLLDPKAFTNWKRYTAKGEEKVKEIKRDKNGIIRENIIIKGNNLLALHSLKEQFTGKIKLIYIDPPYYFSKEKEGDSFAYNANFKLSTWLTFMMNRLTEAQKLLSEDGVIFVQINDDGQGYLKTLMNQLFRPENKLADIIVKVKNMAGVAGGGEEISLRDISETILVYAKDKNIFKGFKNTEFWEEIEKTEIENLKILFDIGKEVKKTQINNKTLKIRRDVVIKKVKDLIDAGEHLDDILAKYTGRIFSETFKNQSSIRDLVMNNSSDKDELVEVD